jgi:alkanesulfonate monooxygenase SsuD/methylene tetrahydromethanopterin reductase-like flavin-dependent oxidoreductase (luciferase family)
MLFHDPVILVRRFTKLDVLSERGSICGLGLGWSKDEYQVSNIPFNNEVRANELVSTIKSNNRFIYVSYANELLVAKR